MTAQGYKAEDFHDAWSRYLPNPPEISGTSGTSGTEQVTPTRDVPDVPDVPVPERGNGQHRDDTLDLIGEAFGIVENVDPDDYARRVNPGLGPVPEDMF
jgi:hypothetical protein